MYDLKFALLSVDVPPRMRFHPALPILCCIMASWLACITIVQSHLVFLLAVSQEPETSLTE
jgi:hypothetical protein